MTSLDGSVSKQVKIRGIFVGVEHYKDPYIRNLFNCKEDAAELYNIFCSDRANKRNSVRLLEKDATRKKILQALVSQMEEVTKEELMILFVSTHGIIEYNDYFFFPYDTELANILGTGISASLLINGLGSLARKKKVKVLMIFDTCHSGAIGFDYNKLNGEISCLFSSSATEVSYEHFDEEYGVFTKALKDALNGDAANNRGAITLRRLFNSVYKSVQKSTQKRQNPILIGNMDNDTVLKYVPR